MNARYVYAIIPTEKKLTFDVAGVAERSGQVHTVPGCQCAAVISGSPLADYRGLTRDRAVPYLVAHQRVLEAVMQDYPLLPVRFGTVLRNTAQVRRLLVQGETLFRTTLAKFGGLVQMEVVILWDLSQVFQEIGREAPIAALKAQLAGRPAEETMARRIAVGQLVYAALERRRAALRDHALESLRPAAVDLVIIPPLDDQVAVNVALLVDQPGREQLDRQLERLDCESGGQLRFRCVGPLPPHSFASVQIETPCDGAAEEAWRRLGLGATTTPDGVRQAYHRLAGQLHPDHNPADAAAESRMADLTSAYDFLTTYMASQAHTNGNTHLSTRRFSCREVKQTLLIAVQRQELKA
jgi:hypothetical protein